MQVRIFSMMDDQVIDAICERLKLKIFIEESKILYPGGPIEKMIFIIRGKLESVEDKTTVSLSEGDVCGEELLTWCLEKYSVNRSRVYYQLLFEHSVKVTFNLQKILRSSSLYPFYPILKSNDNMFTFSLRSVHTFKLLVS